MTHITTDTPLRAHPIRFAKARFALPRLRFPALHLGASVLKLTQIIGEAYALAFAAPFLRHAAQPKPRPDDAEEGRDPNW